MRTAARVLLPPGVRGGKVVKMADPTTTADVPAGLRYASGPGRWVLAATVLGSAIASIDATVVGIALPAIGREFDTGLATLQWVVTAYALTLAGLLLIAGALGDQYGRRRVFLTGVVWFALASVVCGLAPNAPVLIAARALQGVGAALLTPGSLAILQASFVPEDRGKAIGAWSGLSGVATAVGPFLGGWLVEVASWRLIFAINLPIAATVLALAWRHVPESHDPGANARVDVTGGLLVTFGLVGLTYGLIEGPASGWASPGVVAALVTGGVLLAAFAAWERRTDSPMLPLDLFSSTQFTATNLVTFVVYGALGGALFLLPIQLQQVSGYTALQAGVSLLPLTLIMLALSARSGALAARIGPRLQMSVGPVLVGAGLALFTRIGPTGDYLTEVLPAVVVLGLGLATTVAPLTATVLAAAPERHAGMASAVNNDVARAAGLIAVAVLPAAAGITGAAYLDPERFSTCFHTASSISGGLCILAGVLAAGTIRNPHPAALAKAVPTGVVHCGLDAPPAHAAPAART
jgi:EmrB/QacA subfamily drug resistance transporter